MIPVLLDHLWQSTLFAVAAGALTLLFRTHGAGVRHGLWFAASLKFLVPFSLLAAVGAYLRPSVEPVMPALLFALRPAARPFTAAVPLLAPSGGAVDLTPWLLGLWALGFAVVSVVWLLRWSRLRAGVAAATRLPVAAAPVPVRSSALLLEPGLVGIWKPVLLLPEGIAARLSADEMQAILAHELCHLRRHDNLTAAIHMLVEALFWFYPPVWWLGARLIAERERACDESVLAAGNDPQTYAQGILKVCRFYLSSPLACAAGVSGADLNQRMETIMENRFVVRLNRMQKLLLGAAGAAILAAPVLTGLASAAPGAPSAEELRRNLAEQARPRTQVALDPRAFDKYVGYYRMAPGLIFHISRSGGHYFEGVIGQTPDEMYASGESEFFLKGLTLPAQFSFAVDASGQATEMVLHQSGMEQHAQRIDAAVAEKAQADLARRIAGNQPSPGTEAALRHDIDGLTRGAPDYDKMVPVLAAGTRQMLPQIQAKLVKWGALQSVAFTGVNADGMDVYTVTFRNARSEWDIAPLTDDGRIAGIFFGEKT
jgi:beta-lactamase regulating signal transducer with metallopeptidase domain